jgi:hypothetical protein
MADDIQTEKPEAPKRKKREKGAGVKNRGDTFSHLAAKCSHLAATCKALTSEKRDWVSIQNDCTEELLKYVVGHADMPLHMLVKRACALLDQSRCQNVLSPTAHNLRVKELEAQVAVLQQTLIRLANSRFRPTD